ncbi:hypothetical protein KUH03_36760 [Sphingobacterium sp. E70]|uniref:hypothetical protein n=1 Tax=Sphingobacterium sp. E70 TaxID=2853439 RepID=UPI00211B7BC7|nr:hypothetical protein [Sphingobacterium sp. E70]ULT24468.1 hypothetical protein KUH03_36760 [Sphingobacterium sp. E70]
MLQHKLTSKKKEFIIDDFDKAKTLYLIIKGHYFLSEFRSGAEVFQRHDAWVATVMDPEDYVLWLKFGIMLLAEQENLAEINRNVMVFNGIYAQNEWGYDDDCESIKLAEALVNYKTGNLKKHTVYSMKYWLIQTIVHWQTNIKRPGRNRVSYQTLSSNEFLAQLK